MPPVSGLVCLVSLVCLVYLVYSVCSVCLVYLVELDQPDRPNEQDRLADFFSILLSVTGQFPEYDARPIQLVMFGNARHQ
jgi:hypothetical protein